ncbi:MAG: hypothetical protein Q8O89_01885 [Nanoarchaeota archaeon]|nr:hypothetical protein [Nanoarchaeota archaeon]
MALENRLRNLLGNTLEDAFESALNDLDAFVRKHIWDLADAYGRSSQYREDAFKKLDKSGVVLDSVAYLANILALNKYADKNKIRPDKFDQYEVMRAPVNFFKQTFDPEKVDFRLHLEKSGKLYDTMIVEWNSVLKSGWEMNDKVSAKMIVPKRANSEKVESLVVSCNGYREPSHFFHEEMTKKLIEKGVAVLYFPMPFHMQRNPKGSLNGALMINSDMKRNVGFPQAALDLFTVINCLDYKHNGIIGVSLGAVLGAEYTHLKIKEYNESNQSPGDIFKGFDVSVPIIGGSNISGIVDESVLFKVFRKLLTEDNKALMFGYDPGNIKIKIPVTDTYPVFALYDTIVPIKYGEELKNKFQIPDSNCMWFPVGHKSIFLQQKEISEFIPAVMRPYFNGEK